MATYTANYGLHQWVPEDVFVRTDFNTDLSKIDTALNGLEQSKAEVRIATYLGNGAAEQKINLGFTPSAVHLEHPKGTRPTNVYSVSTGLILRDQACEFGAIEAGGFRVYYEYNAPYGIYSNSENIVYCYVAYQ